MQDLRSYNTALANKIFETIDGGNELQLNNRNLTDYFKEYPESSVKLIMNAMDFNQDGVITRSEWFAYWEYIRRAGYEELAIKKSVAVSLCSWSSSRPEPSSSISRAPRAINTACPARRSCRASSKTSARTRRCPSASSRDLCSIFTNNQLVAVFRSISLRQP